MSEIPIYIVAEDRLSESAMKKILNHIGKNFNVWGSFVENGIENIKKKLRKYNGIARSYPVFILIDLDDAECAPAKISDWFDFPKENNLIFRIAIREVESWILSDRENLSGFLGISINRIPQNPETIQNPKEFLINVAKKSRKKSIREDIVPSENTTAKIGKNYNNRLIEFVWNNWNIDRAKSNSISLYKAIKSLQNIN